MNDETTASEPADRSAPHVEKIDMTRPFFLVFDQTETRNTIEVFQGGGAEERATTRAKEKAARVGRQVAVIGPQGAVYAPPSPEAVSIDLPFHNRDG